MNNIPTGYKQTEVGMIPEDWEIKQIQEVCGFIVPGRNKPRIFDGTIPWITTPDLDDGRAVFESRSQLRITANEAKSVGSKIVPKGSVVMSCVGELGIIALAGCDIVLNQQLHAFLPSATINGRFLAHAIKTQNDYIYSVATKTALPYLNKDNCNSIPIPVPPLAEQEAIAEALSDTDALIESLEQLISKKRHLKQGAMQELLSGKKRLPGFSGEWTTRTLRQIVQTPVTDGPHLTPLFLDDGVPFLSVNNLVDNKIDFSDLRFISLEDHEVFSRKCKPRKGDVLLGKAASVGKVAIVDTDTEFNIWSPIALIRVSNDNDARFVYYQLQSTDLNRQIALLTNSSSQGNIGMGDIEKLSFKLPAKPEQIDIATILSDMDAEITTLETKLAKARQLKQGMMHNLLTGRIRLV